MEIQETALQDKYSQVKFVCLKRGILNGVGAADKWLFSISYYEDDQTNYPVQSINNR